MKTFLKRHFLRLFWRSQNRKSVIFELAPGPRSALGAPAGSPPNLQTTHVGNFCTCNRTLFSDYSNQSLTTRSPERGFSTNITLTFHLVQPHCASITKHRHLICHHISNLPQVQDSCVSNKTGPDSSQRILALVSKQAHKLDFVKEERVLEPKAKISLKKFFWCRS